MRLIVETLKSRLDKFLAEQVPQTSRSQLQREIESSRVRVNGETVIEPKTVVRVGDEVEYDPAPEEARHRPKNIPLKTLYNNHGLLIIDKPAGLAVHPGSGVRGDSLTDALLYHFEGISIVGEEDRPGIVHRLDKDTSGVMLVALTPAMYEHLKDAFAERRVKKEYLALVLGKVSRPHGLIDTPVGKSRTDFRKYATKDVLAPKDALTEYRVLEYLPKAGNQDGVDGYTLVQVKLHTGRTHQIRVHFSSLGHPLVGDALYGGKRTVLPGLDRQFLHARRIEVQLPDGAWVEAESPLAGDLKDVLSSLGSRIVNTL
jgi:23S rRNA pseudouridine1911/1915/1917 synthase